MENHEKPRNTHIPPSRGRVQFRIVSAGQRVAAASVGGRTRGEGGRDRRRWASGLFASHAVIKGKFCLSAVTPFPPFLTIAYVCIRKARGRLQSPVSVRLTKPIVTRGVWAISTKLHLPLHHDNNTEAGDIL